MRAAAVILLERAPWLVTPWIIRRLAAATADGFQVPPLPLRGPSARRLLTRYARLTAHLAGTVLSRADGPELLPITQARLRRNAAQLGTTARRLLGITGRTDALRALAALYRCIGIEVESRGTEEIAVTRCFFADYFTPDTCRVAEALDQGLALGLDPDMDLHFCARMTAGAAQCRAMLSRRRYQPRGVDRNPPWVRRAEP